MFTSSLIRTFFYLFNLSFHLSIFIYIIWICFNFCKFLSLLQFSWFLIYNSSLFPLVFLLALLCIKALFLKCFVYLRCFLKINLFLLNGMFSFLFICLKIFCWMLDLWIQGCLPFSADWLCRGRALLINRIYLSMGSPCCEGLVFLLFWVCVFPGSVSVLLLILHQHSWVLTSSFPQESSHCFFSGF